MSRTTNGIGWFEISTDDVPTAERFYGETFGWAFADDRGAMPYRLVTTPGRAEPSGGILGNGGTSPNYAIFYVLVTDVEQTCRQAEAAGGKVLVPEQKDDSGLVFAHLQDPAGNQFGVFTPPAGPPA